MGNYTLTGQNANGEYFTKRGSSKGNQKEFDALIKRIHEAHQYVMKHKKKLC